MFYARSEIYGLMNYIQFKELDEEKELEEMIRAIESIEMELSKVAKFDVEYKCSDRLILYWNSSFSRIYCNSWGHYAPLADFDYNRMSIAHDKLPKLLKKIKNKLDYLDRE
jgi:hypothetical protein